jgi:diacylglycerol kinase
MVYTIFMIKELFKKFSHPLRGIKHALLHDTGFQFQVLLDIVLLVPFFYFFGPFAQFELLFLGLAVALMLITELQNSSFEEALNKLHPERHDSIKKSKDMAAGAVLLAGIFLLFVMGVIIVY